MCDHQCVGKCSELTTSLQLRKQYTIVKSIKEKSGWPWSEACGVVDVPDDVWAQFIEVCSTPSCDLIVYTLGAHPFVQGTPDAKQFRTNGFSLFDIMAQLVEDSIADGCSVVRIGMKHPLEDSEHEEDPDVRAAQDGDASKSGGEGSDMPVLYVLLYLDMCWH